MTPPVWTPPEGVTVVAARHAFRTETLTLEVPTGATLAELAEQAGIPDWAPARAWIDDWEIKPRASWARVRPRAGRRVTLRVVPGAGGVGGGGGNDSNKTLRLVLTIVILIVAIATTILTSGALGPVWATILGGLIVGVGTFAVNALLPPPKPKMNDLNGIGQASPTYALTGTRNTLAPYQSVPRVYGKHRLFPPLAGYPTTRSHLTDQYLSQVFTLGYGPLAIEDIAIGETPISSFQGVDLQVLGGWPTDPPLTNVTNVQFEESLAIELGEGALHSRAAREVSDAIGLEVTFPSGLFWYDDDNSTHHLEALVHVWIRELNASGGAPITDWTYIHGWYFVENRRETLRFSWWYGLPHRGYYEVRLQKVFPGIEGNYPPRFRWLWAMGWSALRSLRYEDPIRPPGMAKIGLVIQASGQLSGVVDQLNMVATSVLPDWNGSAWGLAATRNPAAIFLDMLRGPANARPIPDSQIDWPELQAWADECRTNGYTFDAVLDAGGTLFEQLSLVAAIGRASFTLRDGKYSVVRDRATQTVPVQFFTPRNSNGFTGRKAFVDIPHALKVRFVNPRAGWQMDERIVYDDGYGAHNATKFEVLELFGITNPDLAWRHGRYWLAAARLRPEAYELNVDVEFLVANRGDLVHVTHDVPLWGLAAARVLANDTDDNTVIVIDELLDQFMPGTTLAMRLRLKNGTSVVASVTVWPDADGRVTRLKAPSPIGPEVVGDLVMLGELSNETIPCLIKMIEPGPELTAKLTLVDAAPAILQADQGAIPPFDSQITRPPVLNRPPPPPPVVVTVRSDEWVMVGDLPRIVVHFSIPASTASAIPTHVEAQYRPTDSAASWLDLPTVTLPASDVPVAPVEQGRAYDVRLRSFAQLTSTASAWTLVTAHVVIGKSTPPPAPEGLTLDVAFVELRWLYPAPPPDFAGFEVRYAAGVVSIWEHGQPLHDARVSDTRFHLPPLTGLYTFMVKAFDTAGNESTYPARLVADVLAGVWNVLAETDYAAIGFPGTVVDLTRDLVPPPPQLCALPSGDPLAWAPPDPIYWTSAEALVWGAAYGPGTYQVTVDVPALHAGALLTWRWSATGPGWIFEYQTSGDSGFWTVDTALAWTNDAAPVWADTSRWLAWPGALTASQQRYAFRWSYLGNGGSCLIEAVLVYEVPDLDYYYSDEAIAAAGSRLALPASMHAITTVLLSVQHAGAEPAKTARVLDKNPTLGPLVQLVRLSDGTAVAGVVDAHVRGY